MKLPLVEGDLIDINATNSPQFCRLKPSVDSIELISGHQQITIYWHQVYIAVHDYIDTSYIFHNGVLFPLLSYQDYFEFYNSSHNVWRNEEDTVVTDHI